MAVVSYPSRAGFVAMLERPECRAAEVHKRAGVERTIIFNEIARYADGRATDLTGRQALELYEQRRIPQALPLGVRPGIILEVEGELIGDGRPWEEVRINNFPSRAALGELIRAESLTAAGYEHREAALADTYAVVAAPIVNEVGYLPPIGP